MQIKNTTPFHYKNGELYCDQVSISDIVAAIGTPLYLYSADRLRQNHRRLTNVFAAIQPRLYYSVKANSNLSILRLMNELGSGFDIVSGGELFLTLKADVAPEKIVFAGVGKTQSELNYAIQNQIGYFNVESIYEVELLNHLAGIQGKVVNIALRLRPGVKVGSHPSLVTGCASSKFGMSPIEGLRIIQRIADFPHLCIGGVHLHIGSQLADPNATLSAIDTAIDFINTANLKDLTRKQGAVPLLNIGGGFPINYRDDEKGTSIDDFTSPIISRLLAEAAELEFAIEPGRYIAADTGAVILTVQYRKEVDGNWILVADGGINVLLRPALYDAYHRIIPLSKYSATDPHFITDVVGPICESSDVLAHDRTLPPLAPGDRLAILDTGAYGFSMTSNYNSQPRPAEVLVENESFRMIRRRETYADLVVTEV
jgi:diaminopimelate decarboxylase